MGLRALFADACVCARAAVYELQGPGRDGVDKYFRKPYFMTTVMFFGMSFCLPLAFLEQWQLRRRAAADGAEEARYPLLNNAVAEESFVSPSRLRTSQGCSACPRVFTACAAYRTSCPPHMES
jgi:hypothetical protein